VDCARPWFMKQVSQVTGKSAQGVFAGDTVAAMGHALSYP